VSGGQLAVLLWTVSCFIFRYRISKVVMEDSLHKFLINSGITDETVEKMSADKVLSSIHIYGSIQCVVFEQFIQFCTRSVYGPLLHTCMATVPVLLHQML